MAFYTSLTGLNAATTQLGVTSNNIANVSTTGFKRSRADFGDIFATSPLQKASSVIGKGTALKQVSQEFSQGNIELSGNTLDLAVTGEGFFPLQSSDGQSLYTRNGSFLLDEKNRVSNSAGQLLMVAKVDSLGKADFDSDLQTLTIQSSTIGEAVATSQIDLAINFPADAPVASQTDDDGNIITDANGKPVPKPFDPNDPSTYAKSSAITVFDDNGNDYLATVYYARTQTASAEDPENKWQTYVYLGEQKIEPILSQSTTPQGEPLYVNKYGETREESLIPVNERSTNATFQKFTRDDLGDPQESQPAEVEGASLEQLTYQASGTPVALNASATGLALPDASVFKGAPTGTATSSGGLFKDVGGTSTYLGSPATGVTELEHLETFFEVDPTAALPLAAMTDTVQLTGVDSFEQVLSPEERAQASRWPTVDDGAGGFETGYVQTGEDTYDEVPLGGPASFVAYKLEKLRELIHQAGVDADAAEAAVVDPTATPPVTQADVDALQATADASLAAVSNWLLDRELRNDMASAFKIAVDVPEGVGTDRIDEYEVSLDLTNVLDSIDAPAKTVTGKTLAEDIQVEMNRQLGGERYFDLSNTSNGKFDVRVSPDDPDADGATFTSISIDVAQGLQAANADVDLEELTASQIAGEIERQLNEYAYQNQSGTTAASFFENDRYTVEYSREQAAFSIKRADGISLAIKESVDGSTPIANSLFGLGETDVRELDPDTGFFSAASKFDVIPNGDSIVSEDAQRFGLSVVYNEANNSFSFRSGTTGDLSSVAIYNSSRIAGTLLGISTDAVEFRDADVDLKTEPLEETDPAQRGIESLPATVVGNPIAIDTDDTFAVSSIDNTFSVTVDDVTQEIKIPTGDYTLNTFIDALQRRINAMGDDERGSTVNGVKVMYDAQRNALKFETGTTGDRAFFQITGDSRYGLRDVDPGIGSTSDWQQPVTFKDARGLSADVFVRFDNETGQWKEYSASADLGLALDDSQQFEQDDQPKWRPLFLDKGELTFDTSGRLVSPVQGIELENAVIGSSGNTLQLDIDYTGSTQFTGEFSVNSQSQNGKPNGSLVGLDIADDGLVTASYSNGTQDLKGKIVLSNFSTPNGLRQLGDSTFLESAESGTAQLGEPGSAGYGSIRAGARERANLDLTSELVDLITAQRNFQANAKGLETSSTLTTTIINIRG